MFSENEKISGRQLNRLLILDLFAVSSMALPRLLPRLCGGQGFFAIFLGTAAALGAAAVFMKTADCYGDNFYSFSKRQAGSVLSVVFVLFYMLKFLLSAVFILKLFSEVINRTFLTEMPEKVIAALMILTALYSVSKGIETRGRMSEILMWIVLLPIVFIVILSAFEIKGDRIFPMTIENGGEIWAGAALAAAVFSIFEFLLFAVPYVRNKKHTYHFASWAVVAASVLTLLIYIACIGNFSAEGAAAEHWPTVILMQVIRFPGYFISRQDGLMLAFWTCSIFVLLGGYIFYTDELTKQLFPKKYFKGTMLLWLILVYSIFWLVKDYGAFERFYWKVMILAGAPVSVLIPAGLLICDRLRRKGGRKHV